MYILGYIKNRIYKKNNSFSGYNGRLINLL